MDHHVRASRATAADSDRITDIVTLAFSNDPLWRWALRRPDGRTDHEARFWRMFVDSALRYPWSWLTTGGEATSVWIPPGEKEMTAEGEAQLVALAHECLGSSVDNFLAVLEGLDAAHPHDEPHYYLSLVGTHPDHRGRGIGMGLLAQNLELIDAEHAGAYLESSNPANDPRYARLGFERVGTISFASRGGPEVGTMWRPPRPPTG